MTEENPSTPTVDQSVASDEVVAHGEPSAQEGAAGEVVSDAVTKLSDDERVGLLEALLLAHGDPLGLHRLQEIFHCTRADLLKIVERLERLCAEQARGIEVVVVAEKLQLRTKAAYADFVRALMAVKPRRLSQAALETLSVVAYRQPIVKSEIDKIRGVDVAPTIKTLIERKLIKILGYQASVGQPALYGTTEDFLQVFGLGGLSELPSLRDLKALAKEPGEAQESLQEGDAVEDGAEDSPPVEAQGSPNENAAVAAS